MPQHHIFPLSNPLTGCDIARALSFLCLTAFCSTSHDSRAIHTPCNMRTRPLCSGKDKTHNYKQIWGIVPGLGGWPNVFLFLGYSLWWRRGTQTKFPQKIPGHCHENYAYVFSSFFVIIPCTSVRAQCLQPLILGEIMCAPPSHKAISSPPLRQKFFITPPHLFSKPSAP